MSKYIEKKQPILSTEILGVPVKIYFDGTMDTVYIEDYDDYMDYIRDECIIVELRDSFEIRLPLSKNIVESLLNSHENMLIFTSALDAELGYTIIKKIFTHIVGDANEE